jgi:hypothetical protein
LWNATLPAPTKNVLEHPRLESSADDTRVVYTINTRLVIFDAKTGAQIRTDSRARV